jgi:hypothetical protein
MFVAMPSFACAQINYIDSRYWNLQDEPVQITVMAESLSGEMTIDRRNWTELRILESTQSLAAGETLRIEHVRGYELFPGPHMLVLHLSPSGQYTLTDISHGEIVTLTELDRRARKREAPICSWNVERELCYQNIKLAYDAVVFTGKFEIDDSEKCLPYKRDYDAEYRLITD